MEKQYLNGKWELFYCKDEAFSGDLTAIESMSKVEGSVPGNFELDFERAGILPDLLYSDNILKVRQYEDLHLFYRRSFDAEFSEADLIFEGIDTFAEIYLNGEHIHSCRSMLVAQTVENLNLKKTGNELLVHILPTIKEGRKMPAPDYCFFVDQCYDGAYVRKASHTYGWDIMPRAVSGGIWKDVYLVEHKDLKIDEFSYTCRLTETGAEVSFDIETVLPLGANAECKVEGSCKDSRFEGVAKVENNKARVCVYVENAYLWWPRDYGNADLYDLAVTLFIGGERVDCKQRKIGIRTTELVRTSCAEFDEGAFYFVINGKRVYMRGTNWVPMDIFHSRDKERIPQAFEKLLECNCNSVRLWGGNVYEDELLFELCDKHGIMIWFDFSMACALYPQDEFFQKLIAEETEIVVKKYCNYASIVLWSGDNECDINTIYVKKDPNEMPITRVTIPQVLNRVDTTRPYLPSSPYMDEVVVKTKKSPSEDHNWGDRLDYKGETYTNNKAKFLSEIGFCGMVGRKSLEKFISPEQLWPWWDTVGFKGFEPEKLPALDRLCEKKPKDDWLYHGGSLYNHFTPYSYRIPVTAKAAEVAFGEADDTLDEFIQKSQIVQAEAYKFIVERKRMRKHNEGGVLWWNLIDGCPQNSCAVVDYYYQAKLAFYYLQASQQAVTVVMDSESGEYNDIYIVNDSQEEVCLKVCVRDVLTGETIFEGESVAKPNASTKIGKVLAKNTFSFYEIVWNGSLSGYNHFIPYSAKLDLQTYMRCLEKSEYRTKLGCFD